MGEQILCEERSYSFYKMLWFSLQVFLAQTATDYPHLIDSSVK